MQKYLFSVLLGLIILIIAACGGDDEDDAAQQQQAPAATTAPAAQTGQTAPTTMSLADAAAKLAGGPGSFYIGDFNQLVGPAPAEGLGDANDMVSLAALERESYLFDSEYYENLVQKANFTNPTELTYDGSPIELQFTCINRTVATCELVNAYFVKNVNERLAGAVEMTITSFPELGLAGPDTLSLVSDGTLGFAEIYAGYVAGDMPEAEITFLYGLYPTHEIEFQVNQAVQGDLEKLFIDRTGGGQVISRMWISGGDQFFFCRDPIRTLDDFKGKKTRSHGAALSDWIEGMGAEAQFVAFAEVYTALERGILDCGVTVAFAAMGQRWYEVTDYMVGPLPSQLITNMIMNRNVWNSLPTDIQQILLEEGAKHELEAIRVTPAWNEVWVQRNMDAGLEFIEFTPEMKAQQQNVAVAQHVLPAWINRVGGGDTPIVALFNEKIAPIVNLQINPDGSTSPLGAAMTSPTPSSLADIAAKLAGGPGAIYVGDMNQLVGPASVPDLGGFDGGVPLDSLQRHLYVYESDYYQDLLERANYANPTEMTSSGESVEIQHACINRALLPCKLIENFWAPNLLERTDGQVELVVSSFPELGLAGPDTLSLVGDGTLAMAHIYTGYVAGELPPIEVQTLWGVYPNHEITYKSQTSMHPELEAMVLAETGGVVVNHNWFAGVDQYFFCGEAFTTLEDFKGKKTRSHSAALSDWIEGMGADAQFVAFAEVYTALERGILDCGVTGADPAYGQRWYEVTDYMNGPLISLTSTNNVVNSQVWDKMPDDLRQIFIEEGAKSELEQLRLMSIQNEVGTQKNINEGMELILFSDEVEAQSQATVTQNVIPGWLRRLGGADHPAVDLFNDKVGPWAGLKINPDGTISEVPVTKR